MNQLIWVQAASELEIEIAAGLRAIEANEVDLFLASVTEQKRLLASLNEATSAMAAGASEWGGDAAAIFSACAKLRRGVLFYRVVVEQARRNGSLLAMTAGSGTGDQGATWSLQG